MLESTIHPDTHWTLYVRAERIDNDELLAVPVGQLGQAFTVGKVGLGAIRDFAIARHLKLGLGAQAARNFTGGLSSPYGGDRWGEMGFVRLKLG